MTAAAPVPTRCDTCGQVDTHPKHHYGAETNHHDCTPFRIIEEMTSTATFRDDPDTGQVVVDTLTPLAEKDYDEGTKAFFKARKLAESGTRGDKLRAAIVKGN